MGIEIKIEHYCNDCKAFKPIAETHSLYNVRNAEVFNQTDIKCEHRHLCRYLERRIRREVEREYDKSRTEESSEREKES